MGQWDELLFGIRTNLEIRFLRERYADNGRVAFLAWLRGNFQLAHLGVIIYASAGPPGTRGAPGLLERDLTLEQYLSERQPRNLQHERGTGPAACDSHSEGLVLASAKSRDRRGALEPRHAAPDLGGFDLSCDVHDVRVEVPALGLPRRCARGEREALEMSLARSPVKRELGDDRIERRHAGAALNDRGAAASYHSAALPSRPSQQTTCYERRDKRD